MGITNVEINGVENPVGFSYGHLACSWNVEEAKGKKQKTAKIEVSKNEDFSDLLYSKEGAGLLQTGEELDFALEPRSTYYFRVTVESDAGECATSETCFFETGKIGEAWQAKWITTRPEDDFHPIFSRSFTVEKPVKRARFYGTGVGLFEAYLNGQKLGEEYLMPYVTHYEKNIQVMTLPLEDKLDKDNTFEIWLGKGWYMGVFGLELQKDNFGSRMAAIGEIYLEYADGSTECIVTDEDWTYRGSDIEDSGIYFGEIYNRQLWVEIENPQKPVEVVADPAKTAGMENLVLSNLHDRLSLPVLSKEEVAVREVIHTPAGETVLDMGQNFAGFISFKSRLPEGVKVTLDFGEILQEGNFYNGNYRDAKSQFVYISNGEEELVLPHFTFFGFRYVRVTGWSGELEAGDFTGHVLYSDLRRTGTVVTGNAKLNRLYENTVWGLKSNFIDMPTDCPQRSERLGWTGDAQVFSPTASYHMDTRAFFHKFIKDLRDEQTCLDGAIPNYVPNIGHKADAGSVWGDIGTFLPMVLYKYYGNKKELEYAYPMMKDWVDYIDREDAARGERQYIYNFGFHFGDWLALDGATPTSFKGSTDDDFVASVYYYRSAQLVRQAAEILGKEEDAKHYRELEQHIYDAVCREYLTEGGRLAMDTQAAFVIALKFGIYKDKAKLVSQFCTRLKKDCYQIKCGFVGAPLLCTVLAEAGETELAYDFLFKEGFPSWMYGVDMGATTIWERWNSVGEDGTISPTGMNSLNHYAYGSVMEFVYAYSAGIRPLMSGFQKAVIEPHPDIRMGSMKCKYASVWGAYASEWEIEEDGNLKVHVEVPFGCEAILHLPGSDEAERTLEAGSYDFCYLPKTDFRKPYGGQTTLGRLAKDPEAIKLMAEHVPMLAGMCQSKDPEMSANSLEDIRHMGYLPIDPGALGKLMDALGELNCRRS